MMQKLFCLSLTIGLMGWSDASAFPSFSYSVIRLGDDIFRADLPVVGYDLNNAGQVLFGTPFETYIWHDVSQNGQFEMEETTKMNPEISWTTGVEINNNGDAIGLDVFSGLISEGALGLHWGEDGKVKERIQFNQGTVSVLTAINDHNQIVGNQELYSRSGFFLSSNGYLWQNSTEVSLSTPNRDVSYAKDINNQGTIIGSSSLGSFVWVDSNKNGLSDDEDFRDFIAPFTPYFINDKDYILGQQSPFDKDIYIYFDSNQNQAVEDGEYNILNSRSDYQRIQINDFNNKNDICGWVTYDEIGTTQSAFILTDGNIENLNDVIEPDNNLHLFEAKAVNDSGRILCNGFINGDDIGSFLLIPQGFSYIGDYWDLY